MHLYNVRETTMKVIRSCRASAEACFHLDDTESNKAHARMGYSYCTTQPTYIQHAICMIGKKYMYFRTTTTKDSNKKFVLSLQESQMRTPLWSAVSTVSHGSTEKKPSGP